jgi:hypothetical protein
MKDTLHQIECMFNTKDVRLPNPLRLLTEAALLSLSGGSYARAREAILALSDFVQQLCDSQNWQQLSHWVRTSASRLALLTSSDEGLAQVFVGYVSPNKHLLLTTSSPGTHINYTLSGNR